MKTPMQEMFDQLKASRKDEYGLAFAIDMLLENEQEMLNKEKEEIINAWEAGYDEIDIAIASPIKYYHETFNNK